MNIEIITPSDCEYTDEHKAAVHLKKLIDNNNSFKNSQSQIYLITHVQCHGQRTKDIDIVIIGSCKNFLLNVKSKLNDNDLVKLRTTSIVNFCAAIEVKSHGPEGIRSSGHQIEVAMADKWKSVTMQSVNQRYSLIRFLEHNGFKAPSIGHVIFFDGANKSILQNKQNCIFHDSTIEELFETIISSSQKYPHEYHNSLFYSASSRYTIDSNLSRITEFLGKPLPVSKLDRQKVERISRKILKDQQYYTDKMGKQLLIFRGLGGSGKTFRLLNLAYELYNSRSSRVLILTYNLALVADIKRLFSILRIHDGLETAIQIRSIFSFFAELIKEANIDDLTNDESENEEIEESYYNSIYPKQKKEILEYISKGAITKEDLSDMIIKSPLTLSWDYILIDEAQDWPDDERDILFNIYGPSKIIVADGRNQMVRGYNNCDWTRLNTITRQVVTLSKSLRQKRNICRFVNIIADLLEIPDWDLEENDEIDGGNVVIIIGEFTKAATSRLIEINKKDGNKNIDMLFCVPPSMVQNFHSTIALKLENWGYKTWDGASNDVRNNFPTDLDQLRVVQYDSCRGLEAWITINMCLDKFWEYKLNSYQRPVNHSNYLFEDEAISKKQFASKWLMIPLTRAIDSLVIHLSNEESELSKLICKVANEHPEYCKVVTM